MRSLSLVTVLTIAACNGGSSASPDAISHDASPDAVIPGPNLVTVETNQAPTFIAYRDGKGPWLTPAATSDTEYELHVTNDYQWLIVCTNGSTFDAELHNATFADGSSVFGFCGAGAPPATTVQMTGEMVQAGNVWMNDTAMSTTANWDFALAVPPGTHDFVAVGGNQMLIRRDQVITVAGAVASVDVVANGTAMTAVPLTINNLNGDGDTLYTSFDLDLANDGATISGSSPTLETPPTSLLLPTDYQYLDIDAVSQTGDRSAFTQFTGTETTFTLMAPLTGVTFAQTTGVEVATWGTLPSYTNVNLFVYSYSGESISEQNVVASKSWLDLKAATTLGFDSSAPGYNPAWNIDLTGIYYGAFQASDESGAIMYSTGVADTSSTSVRKLPHTRGQIARAQTRR